jgi:hypothetical protein
MTPAISPEHIDPNFAIPTAIIIALAYLIPAYAEQARARRKHRRNK